jgi:hypothetical protein
MPLIIPHRDISKEGFRLGRRLSKPDSRDLKMARYRTGIAVQVPPSIDWFSKVPQPCGMMLNDSLGDCTCAAAGHMVQQWTQYAAQKETTVPDSSILAMYEQACRYVNGDPTTDNGGDMRTVLNYFRQTGVLDAAGTAHKIMAYISVNPMNPQEVKEAIYLFGNLYAGVNLPNTVQNEENVNSCWSLSPNWKTDPNAAPGSMGGHCIPLVGYTPKAYPFISWSGIYYMTPNFLRIYCDELYAVVSMDWIEAATKLSPSLFDLAQLEADLQVVTN